LRLVQRAVYAFGEELAVAEHRVDGGAQVVGHAREKAAPRGERPLQSPAPAFERGPRLLDLLGLVREPCRLPARLRAEHGALDGGARVPRHDLEQTAVVPGVEDRRAAGQQRENAARIAL